MEKQSTGLLKKMPKVTERVVNILIKSFSESKMGDHLIVEVDSKSKLSDRGERIG